MEARLEDLDDIRKLLSEQGGRRGRGGGFNLVSVSVSVSGCRMRVGLTGIDWYRLVSNDLYHAYHACLGTRTSTT